MARSRSRKALAVVGLVSLLFLLFWIRDTLPEDESATRGERHHPDASGGHRPSPPAATAPSLPTSPTDAPIRVDRKTYRFSGPRQLAAAAVLAAREIYSDKDLPIDFSGATGETPLEIGDECLGNTFHAVPLRIDDAYAGVVLMKDVGDGIARASVVRPGGAAWTEPQFEDGAVEPEPAVRQAYLTEDQARDIAMDEGSNVTEGGGLIIACAGPYPLAPPTAPFYTFQTAADGRVLVSAVTGDVVSEAEVEAFERASERLAASMGSTADSE